MNELEARAVSALARTNQTLATAESCTGGLICHRLTNIPGASSVILGGVVAYCNTVKQRVLGVPEAVLVEHGAVSEACAEAMARGARETLDSALSVAVTGIAGPGGGTPEKPVGLVYIAMAGPNGCRVARNQFAGSRDAIKAATADAALTLLLEEFE